MTKVLGLDLDGVLYQWHLAVYEYHRMYRGYEDDLSTFWSVHYKSLSEGDWEFLTNVDFFYSSIVPSPDCVNFLNNVKYRFELYYITSRPLFVKTTTEQYLKRYKFPFRDNLIFTDDKVNTARRVQVDYFIEDLPKNAELLSKVCDVILIAQPYNHEYWESYKTAHSLMSALQYLED